MKKYVLLFVTAVLTFWGITCVYATSYGDVNLDGELNTKDVNLIQRYASGDTEAISKTGQAYADLNGDGKIDNVDSLILIRHLAGWRQYKVLPLDSDTKVYEYGDVNLDGKVDVKDVIAIIKIIDNPNHGEISGEVSIYADLNEDGKIDETDRLILLRHLAGWKEYQRLPLEQDTKVYLEGDVNKDGKVDEKDLELIDKAFKG